MTISLVYIIVNYSDLFNIVFECVTFAGLILNLSYKIQLLLFILHKVNLAYRYFIVALHNHSDAAVTIEPGDRVAQIVLAPYITAAFNEVEELSDTVRGEGGFGSTGTK